MNYQSNAAAGFIGSPTPPVAGSATTKRFHLAVSAAMLALGNIFEMGPIPNGCRLIDAILDADDLDSNAAPTIALDVGVMSGNWQDPDQARTCDNSIIAASQIARTGVSVERASKREFTRLGVTGNDRSVGVKVQAAPATPQAGFIGVTLVYAPE